MRKIPLLWEWRLRFWRRIRKLRKKCGWRQIDLAEQAGIAGISENYVSDLELGRKEVRLRTIEAFSKALNTDILGLMKGVQ
jgi:transcriptional regulator with XRE-family HTH domain